MVKKGQKKRDEATPQEQPVGTPTLEQEESPSEQLRKQLENVPIYNREIAEAAYEATLYKKRFFVEASRLRPGRPEDLVRPILGWKVRLERIQVRGQRPLNHTLHNAYVHIPASKDIKTLADAEVAMDDSLEFESEGELKEAIKNPSSIVGLDQFKGATKAQVVARLKRALQLWYLYLESANHGWTAVMLEIADNIKAEHKDHNMFWLPLTLVEIRAIFNLPRPIRVRWARSQNMHHTQATQLLPLEWIGLYRDAALDLHPSQRFPDDKDEPLDLPTDAAQWAEQMKDFLSVFGAAALTVHKTDVCFKAMQRVCGYPASAQEDFTALLSNVAQKLIKGLEDDMRTVKNIVQLHGISLVIYLAFRLDQGETWATLLKDDIIPLNNTRSLEAAKVDLNALNPAVRKKGSSDKRETARLAAEAAKEAEKKKLEEASHRKKLEKNKLQEETKEKKEKEKKEKEKEKMRLEKAAQGSKEKEKAEEEKNEAEDGGPARNTRSSQSTPSLGTPKGQKRALQVSPDHSPSQSARKKSAVQGRTMALVVATGPNGTKMPRDLTRTYSFKHDEEHLEGRFERRIAGVLGRPTAREVILRLLRGNESFESLPLKGNPTEWSNAIASLASEPEVIQLVLQTLEEDRDIYKDTLDRLDTAAIGESVVFHPKVDLSELHLAHRGEWPLIPNRPVKYETKLNASSWGGRYERGLICAETIVTPPPTTLGPYLAWRLAQDDKPSWANFPPGTRKRTLDRLEPEDHLHMQFDFFADWEAVEYERKYMLGLRQNEEIWLRNDIEAQMTGIDERTDKIIPLPEPTFHWYESSTTLNLRDVDEEALKELLKKNAGSNAVVSTAAATNTARPKSASVPEKPVVVPPNSPKKSAEKVLRTEPETVASDAIEQDDADDEVPVLDIPDVTVGEDLKPLCVLKSVSEQRMVVLGKHWGGMLWIALVKDTTSVGLFLTPPNNKLSSIVKDFCIIPGDKKKLKPDTYYFVGQRLELQAHPGDLSFTWPDEPSKTEKPPIYQVPLQAPFERFSPLAAADLYGFGILGTSNSLAGRPAWPPFAVWSQTKLEAVGEKLAALRKMPACTSYHPLSVTQVNQLGNMVLRPLRRGRARKGTGTGKPGRPSGTTKAAIAAKMAVDEPTGKETDTEEPDMKGGAEEHAEEEDQVEEDGEDGNDGEGDDNRSESV